MPPANAHSSGGSYVQGAILATCAGILWSLMGLGVRMFEDATSFQILLYRSIGLVATLFVFLAIRSRGHPFALIGTAGPLSILASLFLVIAFGGSIISLKETTIANAVFLLSTAPLLSALLSRIVLGESVRAITWAMMVLGSLGVAIMVVEGISLGRVVGNVAGLLCALAFAAYGVTLKAERTEDSTPVVFFAGLYASVAAAAAVLVAGESITVSAHDTVLGIGLGVVVLAGGLVMFTLGARLIPAAEATLLCMTEVVLAPVWVWLFIGERMGIYSLIGGSILLTALVINALSGLWPERRAELDEDGDAYAYAEESYARPAAQPRPALRRPSRGPLRSPRYVE